MSIVSGHIRKKYFEVEDPISFANMHSCQQEVLGRVNNDGLIINVY
jgi:hypothetical protein